MKKLEDGYYWAMLPYDRLEIIKIEGKNYIIMGNECEFYLDADVKLLSKVYAYMNRIEKNCHTCNVPYHPIAIPHQCEGCRIVEEKIIWQNWKPKNENCQQFKEDTINGEKWKVIVNNTFCPYYDHGKQSNDACQYHGSPMGCCKENCPIRQKDGEK